MPKRIQQVADVAIPVKAKQKIKTTDGTYAIDENKKTVKKITDLKELRSIVSLDTINSLSIRQYFHYIKNELDAGAGVKQDKNWIDAKGFRFRFTAQGIICTDLQKFGHEVKLGIEVPTPREIVDFLNKNNIKRTFSPAELRAASERGKAILEAEKQSLDVAAIKVGKTTDDLFKARDKALRLLKRIQRKEANSSRLFEIIDLIEFRRVRVSLGVIFKKWKEKKLVFSKVITQVREVLEKETFKKEGLTPVREPVFVGLDPMHWKKCEGTKEAFKVDGKVWQYGEFITKFLLSTKQSPKAMPQIMKFLKGEIDARKLAETAQQRDRFVKYEESLLKNMKPEQVAGIERLWWKLTDDYLPLQRRYVQRDGKPFKVGMKLEVWWPESPAVDVGTVKKLDCGVLVHYKKDNSNLYLLENSHYEIL